MHLVNPFFWNNGGTVKFAHYTVRVCKEVTFSCSISGVLQKLNQI